MLISGVSTFESDLYDLVNRYPNRIICLDLLGRAYSYKEFWEYLNRFRVQLVLDGVDSGDTIVSMMPNSIETFMLYLAALFNGINYCPLPCTSTVIEVSRLVTITRAKKAYILSSIPEAFTKELSSLFDLGIREIKVGEDLEWLPEKKSISVVSCGNLMIMTSSTTGDSKLVVISGDILWKAARNFVIHQKIEGSNLRFWNFLPMSYLGGLFNLGMLPIATSGSFFIGDSFTGKTFLDFWATINKYKISALWLVPSIVNGLLEVAEKIRQPKIQSIPIAFLGTAPLSIQKKTKFKDLFSISLIESYGLTETTFIATERLLSEDGGVKFGPGELLPDIDIKLNYSFNADKSCLNNFQDGEILVKTPFHMIGYMDADGIISDGCDAEGFFPTGDLGYFDSGRLIITGRRKDIIKKGGLLINLAEIDNLVNGIATIVESTTLSVKHSFYGEVYWLIVVVEDKENFFKKNNLSKWFDQNLDKQKHPDNIVYITWRLPRTSSGKIKKNDIRKMLIPEFPKLKQ